MNKLDSLYLQDMREVYNNEVYNNIEVVKRMATTASIGHVILAHSYVLESHFDEGKREIKSLHDWHNKFRDKLEEPLREMPLWLSQLSIEQRKSCQAVVREQRFLPEGFAYLQGNIELCVEYGLTMDALSKMVEDEAFAVVVI